MKKKQIITNVKFGKKKIETDKITNNLKAQTVTYQKINNDFQNNTITQIVLVMNPDTLSVNESIKIIEKLKILKLNPWKILINKHQNQNRAIFKPFDDIETQYFPMQLNPLTGLNNLKKHINQFK